MNGTDLYALADLVQVPLEGDGERLRGRADFRVQIEHECTLDVPLELIWSRALPHGVAAAFSLGRPGHLHLLAFITRNQERVLLVDATPLPRANLQTGGSKPPQRGDGTGLMLDLIDVVGRDPVPKLDVAEQFREQLSLGKAVVAARRRARPKENQPAPPWEDWA